MLSTQEYLLLAQKIIANELSGVFNWVLDGLKRLLDQKKFSNCDAALNARKQYELESDSVKLFLLENDYVQHASVYMPIKALYIDYREYCKNDGIPPVKKSNFKKRLKAFGTVIESRNVGDVAFLQQSLMGFKNA